ncbi:hypothetical protein [Desulfosporosinus sp. Sb-LF]|uniref:hypothetical protein n=1 Tax=Desulfosporosinus sp. Sb-LF TaxID=2560027 RepID=UPI00107F5ED7|nr:hypothetical protein [Desulfosporosinus sp. Sb-LF]TGE33210.1 hypothetical protein E4K68_06840 [Desulfosporosinus sp. Sb-LF]
MITSIFDICQRVNFELNLFELLKGMSVLVIITAVVLTLKKIVFTLRKESIIDERVRETSARIARVVAEIEESNEFLTETEVSKTIIIQTSGEHSTEFVKEAIAIQPKMDDTKQTNTNTEMFAYAIQNIEEEQVRSIQKASEGIPKAKKTRAMSMEERWAEFDKKRAMRNTA